jgi:hypothetical protein
MSGGDGNTAEPRRREEREDRREGKKSSILFQIKSNSFAPPRLCVHSSSKTMISRRGAKAQRELLIKGKDASSLANSQRLTQKLMLPFAFSFALFAPSRLWILFFKIASIYTGAARSA